MREELDISAPPIRDALPVTVGRLDGIFNCL